MFWIVLIAIGIILWLSIVVRVVVFNPLKSIYYGVVDLYKHFKYHLYDLCPTGELICYTALFGKGKTLSVVHYICQKYMRYNNKKVWDRDRKKWVLQQVVVISNVDLLIPFIPFTSLSQIVSFAEINRQLDLKNDTLTVTLVLGDEFSVQMNSRNFKSNIDPLFLNTLLTCRHHHITIVYDAQRFNHVDALLRQVTSYVVECNKVWRVMIQCKYDAWDMENAVNPKLVTPLKRYGWFIRDRNFNAYDTLACVDNLKKSSENGDMLTEEQILSLQCNQNTFGSEVILKPSRKLRKNRK